MKKLTDAELAKLHRVTLRTIGRWRKSGAPLGNVAQMKQWLAALHHTSDNAAPGDISASRARKLFWESERAKMLVEKERGELIEKAQVVADFQRIAAAVQSRLALLISESPNWSGLEPHQIQDRAKAFVAETHRAFHDSASYAPGKS